MRRAFWLFVVGLAVAAAAHAAPRKALFVSVIQDPPVLTDRRAIDELVDYSKTAGVDTLYVQVYRENKAWFASKVGDDSFYRKAMETVGEDPFALLIRRAHERGIQVHAWVNLLSVGANKQARILEKHGARVLTRNASPKKFLDDYRIDNQFFLEPGDPRVSDAMAAMVGEVVRAYPDLDGVQLDYIRYPDWKPPYGRTRVNEERYKKATGARTIDEKSEAWINWRKEQVTGLVRRLSETAHAIRPELDVTTTGLTPYSRANLESSQDWKAWVDDGLIPYVTLMAYTADAAAFQKYIDDARRQFGTLERCNIAVAAYKLTGQPAAFDVQWRAAEDAGFRSVAVFHYGNLLENPELQSSLKQD